MQKSSLVENLEYKDTSAISVLFETESTKEIRIAMGQGQVMKEHQTPFPIVVEIFEGEIEFGVRGEKHILQRGDIVALDASTPHDLFATVDSIIRLSLSKLDQVQRVQDVIKTSG